MIFDRDYFDKGISGIWDSDREITIEYTYCGSLCLDGICDEGESIMVYLDAPLKVEGSIYAPGTLILGMPLYATGEICCGKDLISAFVVESEDRIKAGRDIQVGGDLIAHEQIVAKRSIHCGHTISVHNDNLEAGKDILAQESIEVGGDIKASGKIHAPWFIMSKDGPWPSCSEG